MSKSSDDKSFSWETILILLAIGYFVFGDGCGDDSKSSPKLGSSPIVESEIVSDFSGFSSGNVYELANGQLWEQEDYEYSYSYKYRPDVKIYKDGIKYMMKVEDMDEMIEVEELEIVTRSKITNDFDGFEYGNVYELINGQKWEQSEVKIKISIKVMPDVIIFNSGGSYKMLVEGVDEPVGVRRSY
jgi:hypothetical protein